LDNGRVVGHVSADEVERVKERENSGVRSQESESGEVNYEKRERREKAGGDA
jgi:hypothetical protein